MATITDLVRPAAIHGPEDPELATLWGLALAKFETAAGRAPATRADWRAVTRDYAQLASKRHGTLGQIIRERCEEAPGGD